MEHQIFAQPYLQNTAVLRPLQKGVLTGFGGATTRRDAGRGDGGVGKRHKSWRGHSTQKFQTHREAGARASVHEIAQITTLYTSTLTTVA